MVGRALEEFNMDQRTSSLGSVRRFGRVAALSAAAGAALSATGSLAAVQVIYSKKTGHPTATVPGAVDFAGQPEAAEFRGIERLVVSPDGSRWFVQARTTQNDRRDLAVIAGQGTTGSLLNVGGVKFQEGQPAPIGSGVNDGFVDFFPSGLGRFDDQNRYVLGVRARTVQNFVGTSSVSSPAAMRAVVWDGTNLTVPVKQTDPYTGLIDLAPNISGDETVGNSAGSFHLLSDLRVGSHDTSPSNLSSLRRPVLAYDRVGFQQAGVGSLIGLGGSGSAVWSTIDAHSFYTTPSNSAWIASGTAFINGGTPAQAVLVRSGTVVLQAGQSVSPGGPTLGAVSQNQMTANGRWIARGRDNSGTGAAAPDWAVRENSLVARTGDPITPGSTELWGDTFYAVAINRNGDYLVMGNTNAIEPGRNEVAVLNGTTVVFREGDPIDLDGNGQFDDAAFIGRGSNTLSFVSGSGNDTTAFWLTDDRTVWGLINLRDGELSGTDINVTPAFATPTALVRIPPSTTPPACPADFDNSGTRDVSDIFAFLSAWFANGPGSDFDNSGTRDVSDIFAFLSAWFAGCP